MALCKKYKIEQPPTEIDIFMHADKRQTKELRKPEIMEVMQTKPTRTASGVAVVAVMTKPFQCPHQTRKDGNGKPCIYCPGGPASFFGDVPQSYTGKEPATLRGLRNNFDPYMQIFNRLEQYIVSGHAPEKIELVVMGGTFPSFPSAYKKEFIYYCFKAMNDFSDMFMKKGFVKFDFDKFKKFFFLPGKVGNEQRTELVKENVLQIKEKSKEKISKRTISKRIISDFDIEAEQKRNEKSNIKCVALCIETRPDYGLIEHGEEMLDFGCTRVELGVQSINDDVLWAINRGHYVDTTIKSTRVLKDLGFKIGYHMMIGLPGSNLRRDAKMMQDIFSNPDFKPDMIKIYPCMVIKGTELYDMWKNKRFKAVTTEQAASLIADFKKTIPEYCRIQRIQRDIPTNATESGVSMTNLRQAIDKICTERKIKCRCIRCRELGHQYNKNGILPGKISINTIKYDASHGKEFFIEAEDIHKDILVGFCRLRFPSQQLRKEITKDSAIIRELHVYGQALSIGAKNELSGQHKGIGKKLMEEAEFVAKKYKKKKMIIISGVGAKEYYKKLGYKKEGPYMIKMI
jgi:elongator complex protein 3